MITTLTPNFKDLVDFVLANKKDKTFIGYTDIHIINLLKEGIDNGTLLYKHNEQGKVLAMILAEKRDKEKVLFVTENLAMNLANLREFAIIAHRRLPEYRLEWLKHNIHKTHDTNKVYEKLHAA